MHRDTWACCDQLPWITWYQNTTTRNYQLWPGMPHQNESSNMRWLNLRYFDKNKANTVVSKNNPGIMFKKISPIGSMYSIFTYIYQKNRCRQIIHGSFGNSEVKWNLYARRQPVKGTGENKSAMYTLMPFRWSCSFAWNLKKYVPTHTDMPTAPHKLSLPQASRL